MSAGLRDRRCSRATTVVIHQGAAPAGSIPLPPPSLSRTPTHRAFASLRVRADLRPSGSRSGRRRLLFGGPARIGRVDGEPAPGAAGERVPEHGAGHRFGRFAADSGDGPRYEDMRVVVGRIDADFHDLAALDPEQRRPSSTPTATRRAGPSPRSSGPRAATASTTRASAAEGGGALLRSGRRRSAFRCRRSTSSTTGTGPRCGGTSTTSWTSGWTFRPDRVAGGRGEVDHFALAHRLLDAFRDSVSPSPAPLLCQAIAASSESASIRAPVKG